MKHKVIFDNKTYLKQSVDSYRCTGCFFQKNRTIAGSCEKGPWKGSCVTYIREGGSIISKYYIFIKMLSINKLKLL